MKYFSAFWVALILLLTVNLSAQTNGRVLVISDADADVLADGDKVGTTTAGNAFKIELSAGEHYVQIQATQNGKPVNAGQMVNVEAGKQQILKLSLSGASASALRTPGKDTVSIANVDFNIAGTIVVASWMVDNPDQDYPDYPVYYYVLDKGDQLLIDFRMDNKKGTNVIQVSAYPSGNLLYTDKNLVVAKNLSVNIPEKGIYVVSYATNHALDRSCNMRVRKVPANEQSKVLSPNVGWEERTDTTFKWVTDTTYIEQRKAEQLIAPSRYFVNSGSNATFEGGKSRLTIPIDLPQNTVEWYYIVSAYRNQADFDRTMKSFDLFGEIVTAIDATGVAGFAISALTAPPGGDYCDVVLMDRANADLFLEKTSYTYKEEGTRFNIASGLVKMKQNTRGRFYIGLRNPDSTYGEYVAIEAVAVVRTVKKEVKRYRKPVKVEQKKWPVIPQ
jgi:hypothetical protein